MNRIHSVLSDYETQRVSREFDALSTITVEKNHRKMADHRRFKSFLDDPVKFRNFWIALAIVVLLCIVAMVAVPLVLILGGKDETTTAQWFK